MVQTSLSCLATDALTASLDRIADHLTRCPPSCDAEFQDAVHALQICGVHAITIADGVGINVSSITRWTKRVTAPHPNLRPVLIHLLPELARRRAESYRHAGVTAQSPIGHTA